VKRTRHATIHAATNASPATRRRRATARRYPLRA
jgi:hypothetical protein